MENTVPTPEQGAPSTQAPVELPKPLPPLPAAPSQPSTTWHYNAFLYLIAGVLLGSLGTYFVLATYLPSNAKNTQVAAVPTVPNAEPTSLPTVTPMISAQDIATPAALLKDWKMYTNQSGGYSFACPISMKYTQDASGDSCIGGKIVQGGVVGGPNFSIAFKDLTKRNSNVSFIQTEPLGKQTVKVGGVTSNISYNEAGISIGTFQRGNFLYTISYWDTNTVYSQIPEQLQAILASLTFLP